MTIVRSAPGDAADAQWLAGRIGGVRPADIHRDIAALIDERALDPGQQLPTVRDIAAQLGVSVGTVSTAWTRLRRDGLVVTRRRGGSLVAPAPAPSEAPTIDLIRADGDPTLLPDLELLMLEASRRGTRDGARSIVGELRQAASRRWPYRPPELLAVRGVRAALHLITLALLPSDTPIAAAAPLSRRTTDVLRRSGRDILPVSHDEFGPLPDSLAAALAAGASLFCLDPSSVSGPTADPSERRADELAQVLRGSAALIFEEDAAAGFREGFTLAGELPHQVLRAATYTRAFGSLLSVAVLSGPVDAIARLSELQRREGARAGTLDQRLLARLLCDRSAAARARSAANVYKRRNDALQALLLESGIRADSDGFHLRVPVRDEQEAVAELARRGVKVSAGAETSLAADAAPCIRVATTRLPDAGRELGRLAALLADVVEHRPPTGGPVRESSRRAE